MYRTLNNSERYQIASIIEGNQTSVMIENIGSSVMRLPASGDIK
jgi:hypothetical protein